MKTNMYFNLLFSLIMLSCSVASAQQETTLAVDDKKAKTVASAPPMAVAPIIDGVIKPEEWDMAVMLSGGGYKGNIDPRDVNVWVGYDNKKFYFAVRSELPPHGKLQAKAKVEADIFHDDTVELIITPPKDRPDGDMKFGNFQMIINSKGFIFSRHNNPGWGLSYQEWNPEISLKQHLGNGYWDIEIAVPIKFLGMDKISFPSNWGFIVSRNFKNPSSYAAIVPAERFNDKAAQGIFICDDTVPVIQASYPEWDKHKGGIAEFSFYNPSDKPIKLTADIECQPGPDTKTHDINIKPKSKEKIIFKNNSKSDHYKLTTQFKQNGKTIGYRENIFQKRKHKKWTDPESANIFDLNFSNKSFVPARSINSTISIKGKPEIQLLNNKKEHIAFFPPKSSVVYSHDNLAIPGAIFCKLKMRGRPPKGQYRYIWSTTYSPQGYVMLLESDRFIMLNFLNFPWQKEQGNNLCRIIWYKPAAELPGWFNVMVNLGTKKASMYVNGIFAGDVTYPGPLTKSMLGDIRLGWEAKSINNFEISNFKIYDRFFTDNDIAMLGLRKSFFKGHISYFPSLKELVVEAELNSHKLPKNPIISLKVADGSKELKSYPIDLDNDFQQKRAGELMIRKRFKLPELREGNYRCYLNVTSPESLLPIMAMERTFEVKKFEWADTTLGLSDVIIPPFIPLTQNGKEVSCLLKRYAISSNGLPEKIYAKNEQILSRPVELLIRANGKPCKLKSTDFAFTEKKDTKISYVATMRNKLLDVQINGDFDYDGLLKLTLKISPSNNPVIDEIYLDMQLKKEIATLFHAAGTGNRKNPAGLLPSGNGRIWRSRSISHSFDNFVPYVWIGEEEKGLCYIADWDKDWVHTKKRDAVEILRSKTGDVSIRLNLINGPVKLTRTHEIELGIMATPVKPMPKGWRGWSDYCVANQLPGKTYSHCFYAPQTWGSFYACSGQYPMGGDYEVIRKLNATRQTGIVDKTFIEDFIRKAKRSWSSKDGNMPFEKFNEAYSTMKNLKNEEEVGRYVRMMLNWGFNQAKGLHAIKDKNPLWYIYFTCLNENRNMLPEYHYYKDEWKRHMVKSFRDYCIYYANKHLDNGVDGFYLDNTTMVGMTLWPTGDGYIDSKGNVRPSAGVWRIRNYVKRLATLFVEKKKPLFISIHNTNSNALPLYSFANATLGDEWKYGNQDYQERFTPGYLRTINYGRQGGFLPLAIAGITGKDDDKLKWVTRTMLACMLPHEIQPTIIMKGKYSRELLRKIWTIIYDFGKAEKDCQFIPYWQKNNPIAVDADNILLSAYARGHKLLLVAGNYGGDTQAHIKLNLQKLGFSKIISAVNSETGKSFDIKDNTILMLIKKHDLSLITVTLKQ